MRGRHKFKSVVMLADGKTKSITRYPTLSERFDAARAAAPYYAPRLVASMVEDNVNHDHEHDRVVESVSDTARWIAEMLGLNLPHCTSDGQNYYDCFSSSAVIGCIKVSTVR